MLTDYDTEHALTSFRCGGIDPHLFLVSRWKGTEGVSQLYRFEVELASADADIDLESVLGSRATLTLRTDAGDVFPWHGIVTELRQTRRDETYAYYRAVLEPQLALLRLFRQSRVYVHADSQSGGKPDLASVIRMVLEQAGLTQEGDPGAEKAPHYAIRVPASDLAATQSSFICQFEETSLDFLMRRLEHAGVYFWFEQAYDREVVVFGNSRDQQPDQAIPMVWRPEGELNPEMGVVAVSRFDHAVSVQPKGVVLRDFSVSQPSLDLTVKADVDPDAQGASDRFDALGSIEVYGSHYKKQGHGEQIATVRAEEIACQRNRYFGEVRSGGLRTGYPVTLHEHFRDSLNARYYVIQIEHEGRQSLPRQTAEQGEDGRFYHAHFTVLPASLQYRPVRSTRVPRVVGFLSAIVMAEGDGQYAQINEHGCYRIRFLFAPPGSGGNDNANSAWVRMATPYAGGQHGMNFPLLKGTEVLVSFLGGDPDRPVIVAAIPNEENPSIRNQDNATQPGLRTAGQNALEFEDKEGQEHARLSSPSSNTTIHLGTDPKKPEQSGIRMSTGAHVGVGSSSYIQQVNGIYTEEIGRKGQVDTDPDSRLTFEAAQKEQLANYFEEQALLPDAKPAEQLKALTHRLSATDSALKLLTSRLQTMRASEGYDENQIQELMKQIQGMADQQASLASILANPDNEALAKFLEEWYAAKKEKESQEAEDEKTGYQKELEKTGKVAEKTKGFITVGVDHSLIRNTFALGLNNSFFLGANLSLSASASYTACLAIESAYNLLARKQVQTKGGLTVRADKYQTVNMDVEERTIKNSVDTVGKAVHRYMTKTDHIVDHSYNTSRVIQAIGEGGLDCKVRGDYLVSARTVGPIKPKIRFRVDKNRVLIGDNGIIVSSPKENGVRVSSGMTRISSKPTQLDARSSNVNIKATGKLDLKGRNIAVGDGGVAIIKLA